VSTVEGRAREGIRLADVLAAAFPGGSVTGAPKVAALDLIAALEPVGRGASMGALGTVQPNGDFDLALTIRTLAVAEGVVHLWSGGGDRGVVGEGASPARRCRRSGAGVTLLAVAVAGRGLVDPAEPVFFADDEAVVRGTAAFETLRIRDATPVLLDRHVERLERSSASLRLPPPDGARELAREAVAGAGVKEGALRLFRTSATLVATVAPLPAGLDSLRRRGLALVTIRVAAHGLLTGIKSTSYGANM